jgi:inosose dehydratase
MAAGRVLAEMREVGLSATELGPPGFLPEDGEELGRTLAGHGMKLAAGFAAVVLHDPCRLPAALAELDRTGRRLAAGGAGVLVVSAAAARPRPDRRERLDREGWTRLAAGVAAAAEVAGRHGLVLAVHPHADTVVARPDEVRRLLDRTPAGLCLDTGHLAVAGADPLRLAVEAGDRVVHVHLKDVDCTLARRVLARAVPFGEAVRSGLFLPLGAGDLDIAAIVRRLDAAGYDGWWTLEQDRVVARAPAAGRGPVRDVRRSVEYCAQIARAG